MAELNYNDIQRAVQDGLRNIQNDIQRLTTNFENSSRQIGRIDDIEITLHELQRIIQMMQNESHAMHQQGAMGADPRFVQMMTDVRDMKLRFAAVERFAQQMDSYIHEKEKEDEEDRQYRAA